MKPVQQVNHNAIADLCNWDFKDPENGLFYRKRSLLNTDSHYVFDAMHRYCAGKHRHQHLEGATHFQTPDGIWTTVNRTTFAGWYTDKFCDAILDAYEKHFHAVDSEPVLVSSLLSGRGTMNKTNKCPFCPKWFASEKGMWRNHIPTNHPNEYAASEENKRPKHESDSVSDGDYWETIQGAYVRHHIVPREHLFVPQANDSPFPLTLVGNDRMNSIILEHGEAKQFTDNWRSGDSNRSLDAKWTGTTTFYPRIGVGGMPTADYSNKNERKSD